MGARSTWCFLRQSAQKARADELPNESAALAFVSLISLVPLLAGLSYFSVGFFDGRQEELVALLSRVLPYTQADITAKLSEFLVESRSLRGFGFLAFLLTAATAFSMIERSINGIWIVSDRRPFRQRLNSFILLLCWGPILIGMTYSAIFVLQQSPAFGSMTDALPVRWVAFVATSVGLTMLNWQVPHTDVRFRSALVGGVTSATLIELLRWGFRLYVERADQISIVYSSFGFVFFFIVSIQLTWLIVLVGTELAYCVQNYRYLSRPRHRMGVIEGSWLGLAAMVTLTERFRGRQPVTPAEVLADRLGLGAAQLDDVLAPLLGADYLRESAGGDGYLLSCDPYGVSVVELLDLYESRQWDILDQLPESTAERLQGLRARLARARSGAVESMQLVELVSEAAEIGGEAEEGVGAGAAARTGTAGKRKSKAEEGE